MKLPISWAQAYADFACTPQEFADKMTMTGSKVETWEREADRICNVVIGRVTALARHQNSDHLWVCQVDVGQDEPVQIVTGAQNLKEGDVCPVALHGSKLPNGAEIRKGKLRGEVSNGMLCSLPELNLTTHDYPDATEDGILVLTAQDWGGGEPPLGQDAAAVLGMDEVTFEFEITPNRPDCLSVLGLAREAAATYNVSFQPPAPAVPQGTGDIASLLRVGITAPTCSRYAAAVVSNVRIKPSPLWLRQRLRHAGVRPINNIVDITNYVMLEYGHPMHAFDYAYVNGGSITVRMAKAGEKIVTLDDVERTLTPEMMVIADEKGPIAIAGVMGGEYSGVYESTRQVVFESACFDGPNVRATSRKLGLRTESSGRYEKGLDPANAYPALLRALQLVQELDAGDIVSGILDEFPLPRQMRTVPLRVDAINRLLGVETDRQKMVDILTPLGFDVQGDEVRVPTFRYDVERYNDLAEEVARFVGYNTIPATNLRGKANAVTTPRQLFERKMHDALAGYGFWECETFSFYSPKNFDMIGLPQNSPLRNAVKLLHPLGEDTSIMRTTALPSLLEVAARNWAARNPAAALYEQATEYLPAENSEELPTELQKIILMAYGSGWDYLALKGAVEGLLATAGICACTVQAHTEGGTWHPGRCADVLHESGVPLARIGEVHPDVLENYGIKPRVMAADIHLGALFDLRGASPQYTALPKYPAITRDIALVVDETLPAQEIAQRIEKAAGRLLESLSLFDVYTGENLGQGKKSLAYSLVLRDASATLTDADADAVMDKVLKITAEVGAQIRA